VGRDGKAGDEMAMTVDVVRVYDDPGRVADEHRVLVDRLWPRGLTKAALKLDSWAKDVAPSTELRRWYGHDPARFAEFATRYRFELAEPPAADALAELRRRAEQQRLVLLTATRDVAHSAAEVLRQELSVKGRAQGVHANDDEAREGQ
jgi:uncharacterized protein YeaO (DUF488 family)